MEDYEKLLRIDPNALDVEWLGQSSRFMKVAKMAADADMDSKKAKENLDAEKAEADLRIRSDYKENNKKLTEAMVTALVQGDKEVKEALEEYIIAQHSKQVLDYAVRAFEQRKSALENLVKLNLAGYFSEPSDDTDDTGQTQKQKSVDKGSKKQKENLNKKGRSKK